MTSITRRAFARALATALPLPITAWGAAAAEPADGSPDALLRAVLGGLGEARRAALMRIARRGGLDLAPGLIDMLRFFPPEPGGIGDTLDRLAGERIGHDWEGWMLWQEARPELRGHAGYDAFKADLMEVIDPAFRRFLYPGVAHTIRLEEIVWGGVDKDGIPALVDPKLVRAREAGYLTDDEPVFGVEIDGDARAYPLRILDWHEMANDVVGGRPVALAYCTLCGSGILFDTHRQGAPRLIFGSSGFLYRSNKLMYDRGTSSLWNQFTGRPVVGPFSKAPIRLDVLPLVIDSWAGWRAAHPETRVLSLETGYTRDYTPGRPYGQYFASAELMFPARVTDKSLAAKAQVFVARVGDTPKAWPLARIAEEPVINDRIGTLDVVLIGDAASRTVRAFERRGMLFEPIAGERRRVRSEGAVYEVAEDGLVDPQGESLPRIPGHIAYWFAYQSYFPDQKVP